MGRIQSFLLYHAVIVCSVEKVRHLFFEWNYRQFSTNHTGSFGFIPNRMKLSKGHTTLFLFYGDMMVWSEKYKTFE
jgi:hypothetical protein